MFEAGNLPSYHRRTPVRRSVQLADNLCQGQKAIGIGEQQQRNRGEQKGGRGDVHKGGRGLAKGCSKRAGWCSAHLNESTFVCPREPSLMGWSVVINRV